jgi:hypothetical protein
MEPEGSHHHHKISPVDPLEQVESMKITMFWEVMVCSLVKVYQCFGGIQH